MIRRVIGYVLLALIAEGCATGAVNPPGGDTQGDASTQNCCPANFDLYSCTHPDGSKGLACHNPAMGCPSSRECGQGCDPVVSGRCQCIQNVLCLTGNHFDRDLCKCVPDADAGSTCVQNVLCIRGDHFDRDLCKCVPDAPAANACEVATDCHGILPTICEVCSDGTTSCAHFDCVAGACQVATCP
ncbi:MAG TPA: hypothetical protein VIV60_34370 [Polyangiaceae bacterium]